MIYDIIYKADLPDSYKYAIFKDNSYILLAQSGRIRHSK